MESLRRYNDRAHKARREARKYSLEWQAGGSVLQIDLEPSKHLTGEWDREHYGSFVMPFETVLNVDDFECVPAWDPFIGSPRHFNNGVS